MAAASQMTDGTPSISSQRDQTEAARCAKCNLMQFWPASKRKCIRCGAPREEKAAEPEAPPARAPADPERSRYLTVKKLRSRLGLTQSEFARKVGIPRSYVYKLEHNRVQLCYFTGLAVATAFNIKLEAFGPAGLLWRDQAVQYIERDPVAMELLPLVKQLKPGHMKTLVGIARELSRGRYVFEDWMEV